VYPGGLYDIFSPPLELGESFNFIWGVNETLYHDPQSNLVLSPGAGQVTTFSCIVTAAIAIGGHAPGTEALTCSIYLAQNNIPFTAQVYLLHPAAVTITQATTLQLYTSKLGGVDYRFGSDFVLVNADPICTTFNTPNLNLAFVFPAGSTSQLNPALTPIIQPT
jgi:hypothetical protein